MNMQSMHNICALHVFSVIHTGKWQALDIFLDKFHENRENEIKELEAWLCVLSSNRLEDINRVLETYPELLELYVEIMEFQRKPEELVGMYSEALQILDKNAANYMMEKFEKKLVEQNEIIWEQKKSIKEKDKSLEEKDKSLEEKDRSLEEKDKFLEEKDREIQALKAQLAQHDKVKE